MPPGVCLSSRLLAVARSMCGSSSLVVYCIVLYGKAILCCYRGQHFTVNVGGAINSSGALVPSTPSGILCGSSYPRCSVVNRSRFVCDLTGTKNNGIGIGKSIRCFCSIVWCVPVREKTRFHINMASYTPEKACGPQHLQHCTSTLSPWQAFRPSPPPCKMSPTHPAASRRVLWRVWLLTRVEASMHHFCFHLCRRLQRAPLSSRRRGGGGASPIIDFNLIVFAFRFKTIPFGDWIRFPLTAVNSEYCLSRFVVVLWCSPSTVAQKASCFFV